MKKLTETQEAVQTYLYYNRNYGLEGGSVVLNAEEWDKLMNAVSVLINTGMDLDTEAKFNRIAFEDLDDTPWVKIGRKLKLV